MMNKTLLHLSLINGVGPAVIAQLTRVLDYQQFDELYQWNVQDFMYRAGLSERYADACVKGLLDCALVDQELQLIQKYKIKWVTIADEEYPHLLKMTHLPPLVVYWQGADLVFDQPIAIVGSRKANRYGQRVIDQLVPELVAAGCSIMSGGALGADTMAHQATLSAQGKTCAIIGAGLLKPYPASNKRLFEAIIANGGIVMSPFPLSMNALPGNFPARNRIISGMSQATVVVQAAEKSGARITALYALEQGREVCAVPGAIDDPLSAGCHKLISEGAALVSSGSEILTVCGYARQLSDYKSAVQLEVPSDPVVAACSSPQTFDDLLQILEYDFAQLQERLLDLQLTGLLDQDFTGRWYVPR